MEPKGSPLGNPAVPMPVPLPNLVLGLPGMGPIATKLMKAKFDGKNVAFDAGPPAVASGG
jgi:hypothetical protein